MRQDVCCACRAGKLWPTGGHWGWDVIQPRAGAAEEGQVLLHWRRIWKSFMEEVVFGIHSEQEKMFVRRDQYVQRPRNRNEQVFFKG